MLNVENLMGKSRLQKTPISSFLLSPPWRGLNNYGYVQGTGKKTGKSLIRSAGFKIAIGDIIIRLGQKTKNPVECEKKVQRKSQLQKSGTLLIAHRGLRLYHCRASTEVSGLIWLYLTFLSPSN